MADHEVENYPDGTGPFGATKADMHFYAGGRAADMSVATSFTVTYWDAGGERVGGTTGTIDPDDANTAASENGTGGLL